MRELLAQPSIDSQMPVKFSSGATWEHFKGQCRECEVEIKDSLLTGRVTRPFPGVAVIEAVGICYACRLITPFHYRLHDDMRVTGQSNDGTWKTWKARRTIWNQITSAIARALGMKSPH